MKKLSILALAALAVACSGDKESAADTAPVGCTITVDKTVPTSGATDFYYRSAVEFVLSDADSTATVSSTTFSGTQSASEDGKTIYFTPTEPLSPSTDYTVSISLCGGEQVADLSFRTSDLGGSMNDTGILANKGYNLDLAKARIVEPPNIGSVLGSVLTTPILIGVTSVSTDKIQMIGAIAKEGTTDQDYCTPSIDFPEADFSKAPFFEIGPEDTTITVSGAAIKINQLQVSGTFASDGSYFGGGTLSGSLDARDIATALPDLGDADALCGIIAGFGATCESCPDGQAYCLSLVADQITATAISKGLEEVAGEDCPGCETGEPVCPE